MTIQNHRIVEATAAPIPGGNRMSVHRCLVIHFTAGASAMSSIDSMRQNGLSAHLVIDRDGTLYQCRPFDTACGHAGKSRWKDPRTGTLYRGLNNCSIGIELANAGDTAPVIAWARANSPAFAGTLTAKHPNGGPLTQWEEYPAAQLATLTAVAQLLVTTYNLDDITGHDCIAPERKNDPGPAFPMEQLRRACGFTGLPAVHQP